MLRGFLALATILVLLGAACGGDGDSTDGLTATPAISPVAVACDGSAGTPGEQRLTLTIDGLEREYLLALPPSYDGVTPAPVVLLMHGLGQSAAFAAEQTGIIDAAGERGVIAVLPEGTGAAPGWNVYEFPAGPDEAAFFAALLDELEASWCIDPARVYAAGFSNGASMAQQLGCDMPERFAGVAFVAAIYLPCTGPVPAIAFHGDADLAAPFEGGPVPGSTTLATPPVRRSISEWARAIGCDGLPLITRSGGAVEHSNFVNCPAGDGETQLYTILGGGHTWPGSAVVVEGAGVTTQEIDATALMLDFFLERSR